MSTLGQTKLTKSALAAAVALSLGAGGMMDRANADTYTFSFSGEFTMLGPNSGTAPGSPLQNSSYKSNSWKGYRTNITGTMNYDTVAKTGTATVASFKFFGNPAVAQSFTVQAIGNGACTNNDPTQGCGVGNLLLGNMLFNWNGNNGIPVSIVIDATGLFNAMGPALVPGSVVTGTGVLPASNAMANGVYRTGVVPVAMTTWNTTTCAGAGMGSAVSGCLPLIADTTVPSSYNPTQTGIGGNPMIAGPFGGFNANFDFTSMTVSSKNGVSGPPAVQATSPTNASTTADPFATPINVTFSQPMKEDTVASALTLKLTNGGTNVPGSVSPSTVGQTATTFTFTPSSTLAYSTGYTANVSTGATAGDGQTLSPAYTWSFTTEAAPASNACTHGGPAPTTHTAGNFTMLTPGGVPFGGTNDVVYSWDGTTNVAANGTNFNMTLASAGPEPFDGFLWSAHDIRVFGPGTYPFNTGCTIAELHAGTAPGSCAVQGPTVAMTVGAAQVGALMLFDWHGNDNIYVAEVWNKNALWSQGPGSENGLWTGPAWGGPAGFMVDPNTTWALSSTANTGNGINGIPMVNGPFTGFSANFNLDASDSCVAAAAPLTEAKNTKVGGCSINPTPVNLFERSDWAILLGFIGWLGWTRRKHRG